MYWRYKEVKEDGSVHSGLVTGVDPHKAILECMLAGIRVVELSPVSPQDYASERAYEDKVKTLKRRMNHLRPQALGAADNRVGSKPVTGISRGIVELGPQIRIRQTITTILVILLVIACILTLKDLP